MEKRIAKKLLTRTIFVVALILFLIWFLANYIYPYLLEIESPIGMVLYVLTGAFLLFTLILCYQFTKEYIHTIRKNE
jgi:hypothetical protein